MRANPRAYLAAALMLALAACGGSDEPQLMNLRSTGDGPDEFAILPPKPLQMPPNLQALPTPTPGGSNITDPTPLADAVVALGGKPGAGSNDAALVAYATRNGVAAGIRQTLAAEDLEFRRKNDGRLLERIFDVNVYYRAYAPMSLDQHAELERWRRAGAGNPSAPPVAKQ
ncbi:DUF3035 domain-containing protein [Gemmobacter serpentinus]|uniref:DUF3035 domain-containing protein n=1 Tax=Gemmobacter serpentinus TaxID=2652247 RepID=UPI00124C702B|nr:DUF3035 domain-containing protein [Gemmobacter serpentinus]